MANEPIKRCSTSFAIRVNANQNNNEGTSQAPSSYDSQLPIQGTRVPCLVGKLRSHHAVQCALQTTTTTTKYTHNEIPLHAN